MNSREPNHTTHKKAWSSINHSILSDSTQREVENSRSWKTHKLSVSGSVCGLAEGRRREGGRDGDVTVLVFVRMDTSYERVSNEYLPTSGKRKYKNRRSVL